MKNDFQVNTSLVIDNAYNAAREERQMAREQRAAERYRKRKADQEMAAQKRAAALKNKPRPQWNAPERVKRDDGAGVVAEVARYCAPLPPRTRGATWVRVGHMWMRFVTVSGRSGR